MAATEILAATFTIAFEGLMLLQGPSESVKTHVALVYAPSTSHEATMEIIRNYDDPASDEKIVLLPHDEISFDLSPGNAATDSRFDKYVPTLRDYIRFGRVHGDVVNAQADHDATHAVVKLPRGHLSVYKTFRERVKLTRFGSELRCFPRFVLHETLSGHEVTVTIKRGGFNLLPPIPTIPRNGLVIVSNGTRTKGSHFHEYRQMLGRFAWLGSSTILDPDCDEPITKLPTALSNPRALAKLDDIYPRLPNGDCGPVDNP